MRQMPDEGAPTLLAMFVAGALTVLGAVIALGHFHDDWADAGALVLMLAVLGLLMLAIFRALRDDEDP
jgi:hypothetical protein